MIQGFEYKEFIGSYGGTKRGVRRQPVKGVFPNQPPPKGKIILGANEEHSYPVDNCSTMKPEGYSTEGGRKGVFIHQSLLVSEMATAGWEGGRTLIFQHFQWAT